MKGIEFIGAVLKDYGAFNGVIDKIDILHGKATELWNTKACVEKDVESFIVFAVDVVLIDEVKELSHVTLADCLSPLAVVNQKALHLKVEWVLKENVIINRQLKSRS